GEASGPRARRRRSNRASGLPVRSLRAASEGGGLRERFEDMADAAPPIAVGHEHWRPRARFWNAKQSGHLTRPLYARRLIFGRLAHKTFERCDRGEADDVDKDNSDFGSDASGVERPCQRD